MEVFRDVIILQPTERRGACFHFGYFFGNLKILSQLSVYSIQFAKVWSQKLSTRIGNKKPTDVNGKAFQRSSSMELVPGVLREHLDEVLVGCHHELLGLGAVAELRHPLVALRLEVRGRGPGTTLSSLGSV